MRLEAAILTTFASLLVSQKPTYLLLENQSMTKRTAALAAAAKLSSSVRASKVAKKSPPPAAKKKSSSVKAQKPAKAAASTSVDSEKPWYTIFTKSDPEYDEYMSREWGFEKRGDDALFEKICLEGAQSGLSWLTILRKREAYRSTFHNFDIGKVAVMTAKDVQRILDTNEEDPTNMVVRHRGKIEATINNAKCIQTMYEEEEEEGKEDSKHGIFDSFLWSFVNDKPILNTHWKHGEGLTTALTKTPESEAMSKALKKKGFRFVGPTTCYAMMQSVGMVIDHPAGSPEWHAAVERLGKRPGGYQKDTDVVRDPAADTKPQKAAAKRSKKPNKK
ncbi:DNA-3-methyladenine glycosylase [Seminavis robusta]|uniref:DNA-3-methyladenine glycosylase n=1 Tax=Seminavis robusta TaxID=568900 RepID=A0A9N8DK55_9STRA|nr:DNA-3-methyladenine glycosylase [Seminavis robusta]|eukprot:Sro128_g061030.1 DNA-3-methyladenine glycosylase (333) ;mRNA; r:7134-8271